MQINMKQLGATLKRGLAPVYLISGDVPLLVQEARDAIRKAALQAGYTNYELLIMEAGFDWGHFSSLTQNLSLFSEKTLIDLRNPNAKFDDKALEHLLSYCAHASDSHLLIISMPKLTSAQQKTAWYKDIDKAGVTIPIWPLYDNELPSWIQQRLQNAGLKASDDSVALLIQMTTGNLLATQQTIDKLRLLFPNAHINREQMLQAITQSARYSVFDLTNAVLLGKTTQVVRIMQQLPYEEVEPPLVLWALCQDIRELLQLHSQIENGASVSQLMAAQRSMRKPLVQAALQRTQPALLQYCLQLAAQVDLMIKGLAAGKSWEALTELALTLAGAKTLRRDCV